MVAAESAGAVAADRDGLGTTVATLAESRSVPAGATAESRSGCSLAAAW
jgi:hypothetical protein